MIEEILGADMKDEESRDSLKKLLSVSLVMGITNDCLKK